MNHVTNLSFKERRLINDFGYGTRLISVFDRARTSLPSDIIAGDEIRKAVDALPSAPMLPHFDIDVSDLRHFPHYFEASILLKGQRVAHLASDRTQTRSTRMEIFVDDPIAGDKVRTILLDYMGELQSWAIEAGRVISMLRHSVNLKKASAASPKKKNSPQVLASKKLVDDVLAL